VPGNSPVPTGSLAKAGRPEPRVAKRGTGAIPYGNLGARTAPGIYKGVVAVTRQDDATLALGGGGHPVDWCIDMARFDQNALPPLVFLRVGGVCQTLNQEEERNEAAPQVPSLHTDSFLPRLSLAQASAVVWALWNFCQARKAVSSALFAHALFEQPADFG